MYLSYYVQMYMLIKKFQFNYVYKKMYNMYKINVLKCMYKYILNESVNK